MIHLPPSSLVALYGCLFSSEIRNFTQWPLPAISGSASSHIDAEMTRNQLNELKKKLTPVQQMILSLRPRKKLSLIEYIPDFEAYDNDINTNDNDIQSPATFVEAYENDNQGSLSERLYNEIDGRGTTRTYRTRRPELVLTALLGLVSLEQVDRRQESQS